MKKIKTDGKDQTLSVKIENVDVRVKPNSAAVKKVIFYPHYTEELRNLLRCVCAKIQLEFRMLVFVEGGKLENQKPLEQE